MIADYLDELLGHLRLAGSRPRGYRHGEYDALATISRRRLRRLRGAGWLVRHGDRRQAAPDVIAAAIEGNGGPTMTVDELWAWYVRTAIAALDEQQRHANRRRHEQCARRHGHRSYYERRAALAVADGYVSLWDRRKALGWQ